MAFDRLMAAIPLTEVEAGQKVDKWPPHITLVPWFDLESNRWSEFDQEFRDRDIIWDLDARMMVAARDRFGEHNDVPVARLFGIMAVLAHTRIKALVEDFGSSVDERFTGLDWHPHISDSSEYSGRIGDAITTDRIALFQKNAGEKIIKQIYARQVNDDKATA